MILVDSLNQGYMFRRYSWMIPGPVIMVEHGRKTAALEQLWSTIVSMVFFLFDWGNPVIRSIATCENGLMFGVVVIPKSGVSVYGIGSYFVDRLHTL